MDNNRFSVFSDVELAMLGVALILLGGLVNMKKEVTSLLHEINEELDRKKNTDA